MELNDRVEQISGLIRELRQSAGDGRKSRELIDALFRAVHSFKAAASAEGRHHASGAGHEFENILHALRTGQLVLDNDALEACEHSAAGLLDGSAVSSYDSFTVTTIDKTRHDALLPDPFSNLRNEERHRATAAIQEGSNLYVMEATFDANDFDERFKQLKTRLSQVAEIISSSPTMDDDKINFQIVYASKTEKIPVQSVLSQAALAGKSLASNLGKQVEFVVRGDESLLERPQADALADALLHLVRNAIDHGIESQGTVVLETTTTPDATLITVTDDGRGIAAENVPLVFQPGFSTASEVTEFSGRGVGLDVVKTSLEKLGGSVSVASEPQKGSSFQITIPNQIKIPDLP